MDRYLRLLIWLTLGAMLTGCGFGPWQVEGAQPKAPHLSRVDVDLTQFWQEAAESLQIKPEEGRLNQLNLGYDENGEILYLFFHLYVDQGYGKLDSYYFNQHLEEKPRWGKQTVEGSLSVELPLAHEVFAAIDEIGILEVARHEQVAPPARFWFIAHSGSGVFKAGRRLVQDGRLIEVGPEGVGVLRYLGYIGVAEGAITYVTGTSNSASGSGSTGSGKPPIFLLPLSPSH